MPEEQNKVDTLSQSIGEEYARRLTLEKNIRQNTNDFRRQKQMKKTSEATSRFYEALNKAPETESDILQFQSLNKGDIGGEDFETQKKQKQEEQREAENYPPTKRPPTAKEADLEQTQISRDSVNQQNRSNIFNRLRLSPKTRQMVTTYRREISETEGELSSLKGLKRAASTSGLVKVLTRWVQIVVGGYVTIILGIILTLASVIVVPLIVIVWMAGFLPKSLKERELNKKINEAEKKLKEQRQRLAKLGYNR